MLDLLTKWLDENSIKWTLIDTTGSAFLIEADLSLGRRAWLSGEDRGDHIVWLGTTGPGFVDKVDLLSAPPDIIVRPADLAGETAVTAKIRAAVT